MNFKLLKILKYIISVLLLTACSSNSEDSIAVTTQSQSVDVSKDTFDPKVALAGATSTKESCDKNPDSSVWVVVEGRGDCIRYFAHNIKSVNEVAAIWLSGDRIQSRINKAGKNIGNSISWYADNSPQKLLKYAGFWKSISDKPYIWLSRPGIYGSSGSHKLRRQPRNVFLVNAAVSQIKAKHNINKVALMGQSGGGHLVAALLSMRSDIKCAVIGAGAVSVAERNRAYNWNGDITGFKTFVDPIINVDKIQIPTSMRVLVIGDKKDKVVPFSTMRNYNNKLAQHGINTSLLAVQGGGKKFHQVQKHTSSSTADCLDGISISEIAARRNAQIIASNEN